MKNEYVIVVRANVQVGPSEFDTLTFVKDVTGMTVESAMEWAYKKADGTPIEVKIIQVEQN